MTTLQRAIDLLRELSVTTDCECEKVALELEAMRDQEPVAVVGSGYQLLYASPDSMAAIAEQHSLKVGSLLYAAPVSAEPVNAKLLELLKNLIAGYEDTSLTGVMDMQVIGQDAIEAVKLIASAEQAQAERIKELLSLNEALNTNLEAAQESISEQLEVGKGYLLTIAELLVVLKICANSGTGEWYPYSFEQGRTAAKKSIERMQGEGND